MKISSNTITKEEFKKYVKILDEISKTREKELKQFFKEQEQKIFQDKKEKE